jgi:uracil-DNA glycosylase family 4
MDRCRTAGAAATVPGAMFHDDREARLAALHAEIRAHHGSGCGFEPCETCTQLVPGEGSARARIVVIGEAPGAREDQQGRPFVGNSGKLLDGLLLEAGRSREEVFITNVVKARPPGNRDPRKPEVVHHWPWLEAQLALIGPVLLVPLGRHALARFAPEARIGEVHGTVLEHGGRRLFPLYHPAAALHNPGLRTTLVDDARALGRALDRF